MDVFCDARETSLQYGEYVNDVQRLLISHELSCGAPEDFGSLTVKLDESKTFRADFSTLVRSVHQRAQASMTADQMLTILALASGGPLVVSGRVGSPAISRTINLLGMLLAGVGSWAEVGDAAGEPRADEASGSGASVQGYPHTSSSPGHFDGAYTTASQPDHGRPTPPERDPLQSAIQDVIVQLGSIQSRMGRLEQVIEQDLDSRTAVPPESEPPMRPPDQSFAGTAPPVDQATWTHGTEESSRTAPAKPSEAQGEIPDPTSTAEKQRRENFYRALANLDFEMKGQPAAGAKPQESRSPMSPQAEQDRNRKLQILAGSAAMILVIAGAIIVGRSGSAAERTPGDTSRSSATTDGGPSAGQFRPPASATPNASVADALGADVGAEDHVQGGRQAGTPEARVAGKRKEIAQKEPQEEDLQPTAASAPKDVPRHIQRSKHPSSARASGADLNEDPPLTVGPADGSPVSVPSTTMEKHLISGKKPVYPAEALDQHMDGTVVLNAYITRDGSVRRMDVVQGQPIFLKSAIAAVSWSRYKPYLVRGRRVEVVTQVTVKYPPH